MVGGAPPAGRTGNILPSMSSSSSFLYNIKHTITQVMVWVGGGWMVSGWVDEWMVSGRLPAGRTGSMFPSTSNSSSFLCITKYTVMQVSGRVSGWVGGWMDG